jgi:hypothetical protein
MPTSAPVQFSFVFWFHINTVMRVVLRSADQWANQPTNQPSSRKSEGDLVNAKSMITVILDVMCDAMLQLEMRLHKLFWFPLAGDAR